MLSAIKCLEAGGVDETLLVPSHLRLATLQQAKNAAKPIWTQMHEAANRLKQVQQQIVAKTSRAKAIHDQQEQLAQEAQQVNIEIIEL